MANGNDTQPTGILGTAPQGVEGLLGDPIFNVGIGLLASGLSQPRNLGVGLAQGLQLGGGLQQQQTRNALLRQRMQEEARQQRARQELTEGLLAQAPRVPVSPEAPQGVAGLMDITTQPDPTFGLLARAAPEEMAKGLIGQMFDEGRADPSVIRTLRAAGIDPQSPEGQDLVRRSIAGQDISGQMAQLQLMQTQLEIQRQMQTIADARREATEAERAGRSRMGELRRETFTQLQLGQEAAQLLEDLEGTFGQTGFGAEFRGSLAGATALAQDMFGGDSSQTREIASRIERLNQIATDFGFENFNNFAGAISDREVQIALGKDLSINKTPEANRQALADRLEIALHQADVNNFEVQDRAEIEGLIARLRNRTQPEAGAQPQAGQGAQPGQGVIDFNDLPE